MPVLGKEFSISDRPPKDLPEFCQDAQGRTHSARHADGFRVRENTGHPRLTALFVLLSEVGPDEGWQHQVLGHKDRQSECCVSAPIHI